MRNTAQELAQAAAQLPDLFTDWQPGQAAPTGVNLAASVPARKLLHAELFDAQRLGYLADEFTENGPGVARQPRDGAGGPRAAWRVVKPCRRQLLQIATNR